MDLERVKGNIACVERTQLDPLRNYLRTAGIRLGRVQVKPFQGSLTAVTIRDGINTDEADQLLIALEGQPMKGENTRRFELQASKLAGFLWQGKNRF